MVGNEWEESVVSVVMADSTPAVESRLCVGAAIRAAERGDRASNTRFGLPHEKLTQRRERDAGSFFPLPYET